MRNAADVANDGAGVRSHSPSPLLCALFTASSPARPPDCLPACVPACAPTHSRCTKFRFAPLKKEQIEGKLRSIVEREGLSARCSDDGIEAVLRLARGDMRKVLNVLQATASGFEQITCETVHLCTGQPLPSDVAEIQRSLMNDDFEPAFATLMAASHGKGLSLVDIVTELAKVNAALKMPPEVRILLADKLSDIEYRLAFGTNDKIQGASLVGAYAAAREVMRKYVPQQKA